jgi:hypothetical protein
MPPIDNRITPSTIVSAITLFCLLLGGAWFIYPLRDYPADRKETALALHTIEKTQAVQTEALKTLAEVVADTKEIRRDLDHTKSAGAAKDYEQDVAIRDVTRRLDRIDRSDPR